MLNPEKNKTRVENKKSSVQLKKGFFGQFSAFTKKNKNTEITDETVLISASDATGDDNNNNNNSNNSKSSSTSSSSSESELENAENEEEKKLSPEQREIKAKMLRSRQLAEALRAFNDYQAFINTEINSMEKERERKRKRVIFVFIYLYSREIYTK